MVLSFILILLIAFGGFLLTYLFAEKETFLWRLAAGNIIGSAIFGLLGFVIASFFGLSILTASLALVITFAPLALLAKNDYKRKFLNDWHNAKNRGQGASVKQFLRLLYYVGFFLLFVFFFDRAIYETRDGIFTGASQNLGDLPFHLGAIFSFTEGNNFPPQNPSFAGAKFSYPFIADLLTALIMKFGADVPSVFLVQNVSWALSLLIVLERFVAKLTNNKLAGKIAPVLLFFSGGLGFWWFWREFGEQSKSFYDFLWSLPIDYTIRSETLRWGNSLNVLFITQRSLLLGMPLTLIVLQKLWEIFVSRNERDEEMERRGDGEIGRRGDGETEDEIVGVNKSVKKLKLKSKTSETNQPKSDFSPVSFSPRLFVSSSAFIVGLLAGMLPLIHLHSLAALFVVTAFLFFLRTDKWREWIAFGVGTALIAVPELAWSLADTATRTSEFFGWRFGWHKGENENFVWFWLQNTGLFIPLIVAAIALLFVIKNRQEAEAESEETNDKKQKTKNQRPKTKDRRIKVVELLLFFLPFVFLFVVSNVAKFAPWDWDNIKILIYWFVGALPLVSLVLAWAFNQNTILKIAAGACLFLLIAAGALDVWRIASGQVKIQVFNAEAVEIADKIKLRTAPDAMFLNAPTFNSAIVLTGRRSVMRYVGHLSSHGIDYFEREADVKKIYEGNATADILLRKYNVEYVLISPEERGSMTVNEDYFKKFPLLTEVGESKVYKVKN